MTEFPFPPFFLFCMNDHEFPPNSWSLVPLGSRGTMSIRHLFNLSFRRLWCRLVAPSVEQYGRPLCSKLYFPSLIPPPLLTLLVAIARLVFIDSYRGGTVFFCSATHICHDLWTSTSALGILGYGWYSLTLIVIFVSDIDTKFEWTSGFILTTSGSHYLLLAWPPVVRLSLMLNLNL